MKSTAEQLALVGYDRQLLSSRYMDDPAHVIISPNRQRDSACVSNFVYWRREGTLEWMLVAASSIPITPARSVVMSMAE